MKAINDVLKEIRKRNGKTQQEIANVLNLEVSSYGKKELGQSDITYKQLELISNFYGMSVIELLAYPYPVIVNNEKLQPTIKITIDVGSKNQKDKVLEVLNKIEDINIQINK
jgi:transcriptional regulator with XRE-family HTH domain